MEKTDKDKDAEEADQLNPDIKRLEQSPLPCIRLGEQGLLRYARNR